MNDDSSDTKWQRILRYFAKGGRLTRFDAEKLGDHALNSTISYIEAKGVQISREPLVLEGRFGKIHCKKYWLEKDQRKRALQIAVAGSE